MHMLSLDYLNIEVHLLLGYASERALSIFNHIVPQERLSEVPLDELTQIHDLPTILSSNRVFKEKVVFNVIYHERMRKLRDSIDDEGTTVVLERMGIPDYKTPIYFAHKMPDYISSYSEVYMGFTLRPPYDIIPLINNCEAYYNRSLLKRVRAHLLLTNEDYKKSL